MVAAGFTENRGNNYRRQGREWQPRKPRPDGLPPMLAEQQLDAPWPTHMYTDDNGNRKSNHKLKDCRRFQLLAEIAWKKQQEA
jgi:hypothetical protein